MRSRGTAQSPKSVPALVLGLLFSFGRSSPTGLAASCAQEFALTPFDPFMPDEYCVLLRCTILHVTQTMADAERK